MKYVAKQMKDGNWVVASRTKHFMQTVTTTKQSAQEKAIIMSVEFHYGESKKLYRKLEKINPKKYDSLENGYAFGDLFY